MASTIILRRSQTMHQGFRTLRQYHNVTCSPSTARGNTCVNLIRSRSTRHSAASRQRLLTHDTNNAAAPLQLYPYQSEVVKSCIEALQGGRHRIGVSLPTGSGKTAIYTALISSLYSKNSVDGHILVLVPNIDLAQQTYDFIKHNLPRYSVGLEQGNTQASGNDYITVATYHSLRQDSRLAKYSGRQIKAIIIDEAHHVAASSYRKILSRLTASSPATSNIPIIGFSATLGCRADGQALSEVFNEIVFHKDVSALIDSGDFTPATYTNVRTGSDFSGLEVSRATYDFDEDAAHAMVNTPPFTKMVVETYLSLCKDRKCTLVYALNYKHTRDLLSAFRQAGVRARILTGFSTAEERNQTLADFAQGKFSVLIGSLLLVESASMPSVDCIFLARPTRSRIAFAQMVGRGALIHPGKPDYRIIDFCDNKNHNGGFNALATLSGVNQATYDSSRLQAILQNRTKGNDAASLHDFAISEEESPIIEAGSAKELVHYEEEAAPFHASDGEDPFSRDCPEGRKARRMSRYAWVCCGTGRYILPISSEDCLSVTLVDQTFVIKWEGRVTRYLFFSRNEEIQIGHASDPHAAFEAADVMLEESLTRPELANLQRFAPWRSRSAGTEGLEKLKQGMGSHDASEMMGCSKGLTAGQVSSILTILKQTA